MRSVAHDACPFPRLDLNPPPSVDEILNDRGDIFHVLREDRLLGGTKQRAARRYVARGQARGVETFCYASPFAGFAQVALSVCCHALGTKSHIFAEQDQTAKANEAHEFSRLARDWGATVHLFPTLNHAERAAHAFAFRKQGCEKIPLGFSCPDYNEIFQEEISSVWEQVKKNYFTPKQLWAPVGSGTLAMALRAVLPPTVALKCLNVRVLPDTDDRLTKVRELPNTFVRTVPELFADPSELEPPIPSNRHYDAKLWRYLRKEARPGDLWWNVAR